MGARQLIHSLGRFLTGPAPAVALSVLLLAAVFMLTAAAKRSEVFSGYYTVLLAVNALGIIALTVLIAVSLLRLVRQFRAGAPGSRLGLRLLGMFVLIALIPLVTVYYLSVQFISKGIDSWFDVRIEQALDDALMLGRASLEAVKDHRTRRAQQFASQLSEITSPIELVSEMDEIREQTGITEMTLFSHKGRVIAASSLQARSLFPVAPGEAIQSVFRRTARYANIEPGPEGLRLRIIVPVFSRVLGQPLRALQVVQPLPLRHAQLGESVQAAFAEYERLAYLRQPLKFSFVLTLTLVTLMTLLLAVLGAIYISRRLVAPLGELAEGTRAVAAGDYRKTLPVGSADEFGVLAKSFNEMTRRIHKAQSQARASHREADRQRVYLETVLGHLSSGVFSFDRNRHLRTQNTTANEILDVSLNEMAGTTLEEIALAEPRLEPFLQRVLDCARQGQAEWQFEVTLFGARGRQVLICRGTRLPGQRGGGGYVAVFDDVTALINAQRDAAWAEVARRLAHEIKNPLTPIQLSAERIRHKCLNKLPEKERETLDRATRTIVDQVEAVKAMVNSFSNYAQPKRLHAEALEINGLIRDVLELHRGGSLRFDLDLDEAAGVLVADRARLRQVINNLVINARDALQGAQAPCVKVTTRLVREPNSVHVELRFHDNGPGFPPALIDHIFDPYVTTKGKGGGLGLAIVKRIIEEHGGALFADNSDGGRVTIRLPVAHEQHSKQPKTRAQLA